MDEIFSREVILVLICAVSLAALTWEIVQCVTVGFGGIPEKEAEDEK